MLTMIHPKYDRAQQSQAPKQPDRYPVSECDFVPRVKYISPQQMVQRLEILRSIDGDSPHIREAIACIRATYG